MSVSSTFTTVAQNGLKPIHGCGAGADQFHPAELDHVRGEQRGDGAEREGPRHAVSQRLFALRLRQAEHQDRKHHRVVGAQQTFERDQQANRDEIGRREHRSGKP
jgi:hypothetical protein